MPLLQSSPTAKQCTTQVQTYVVTLMAGQQHLTCLAPGATLQVMRGCVEIASGPLVLGQVLTSTKTVMETGDLLSGEYGSTTWVRVQAKGTAPVRLLHTDPATPQPLAGRWLHALRQARKWLSAGSGLGRTQAQ